MTNKTTSDGLWLSAQGYARNGWPVFPLQVKGKRPVTANGFKDATTDVVQIERWWRHDYPGANIGVPTGAVSGTVVLDVDGPEGGTSLVKLESAMPTRTSITGKGYHAVFAHPGVPIKNGVKVLPDLDVRGDGGYIVVPPSIHPDGHQYHWDKDNGMGWKCPLAPLSRKALDALSAAAEDPLSRQHVQEIPDTIIEGGRNEALYKIACSMRTAELTPAAVESALLEENARRCNPPLPVREVRDIARKAAKHPPGKSMQYAGERSDPPRKRSDIVLVTAGELTQRPLPRFVLQDIMIEGSFGVLVGEPGVGKSFLALDWALSMACDLAWLDRATLSGPTVYVAAEGAGGLGPRVAAWASNRNVSVDELTRTLFFTDALQGLDSDHVGAFIAQIQSQLSEPPVLVVIDTMARNMLGGDENSVRDVGQFIQNMADIQTHTGAAVLLLHHLKKDGSAERGSSALRGAADMMCKLFHRADGIGLLCMKQKDFAPFETMNMRLVPHADSAIVEFPSVFAPSMFGRDNG